MFGKTTRGKRRIQLIDDLLEKKNYRDLKKSAQPRNIWGTVRKDCLINEQPTNVIPTFYPGLAAYINKVTLCQDMLVRKPRGL